MKKQKGITLLAMLITMGVMLLIVGITVAILVKNSKSDIEYSAPQTIEQSVTKLQENKQPSKTIEPVEDEPIDEEIPEENEPIEEDIEEIPEEDELIEEDEIDDMSDDFEGLL